MRGKSILLVAGILTIASGGFGMLGGLALLSVPTLHGVAAALMLVAAAMIVIGILGVKYRQRPEKAKTLMVIGIVLIAIEIIALAMNIINSSNPVSSIGGIILGGLYFIGAKLNQGSGAQANIEQR